MPALYRIHEPPDPLKVLQFEEFVGAFGLLARRAGERASSRSTSRSWSRRSAAMPAERPIAFLMLRTMQKARYDAMNVGHFGLAADDLHALHFADSPLSRPGRAPPAARAAADARSATNARRSSTRTCRKSAATPRRWSAAPPRPSARSCSGRRSASWPTRSATSFDGYITGVAPFGMFVELIDHYVEGLVHVSTMADDYYRFREQSHALFGENTKKTYRLGDQVRVQIVRVDMERRQIDLGLDDVLEKVRRDERSRGPAAQFGAAEEGAAQGHAGGAAQAQTAAREERARV